MSRKPANTSSESVDVMDTMDAAHAAAKKIVVAINLIRIEENRDPDDLPDGGYGLSEAVRILDDIRKELAASVEAEEAERKASQR